MTLLRGIQHLLYVEGYAIRGVQKIMKKKGADRARAAGQYGEGPLDQSTRL